MKLKVKQKITCNIQKSGMSLKNKCNVLSAYYFQ